MKTTIVYLLHFQEPLHHAQHYLGSTSDLFKRLRQHWTGKSRVCIVNAFIKKQIPFVLAQTWQGDKRVERHLKERHNNKKLCPICRLAQTGAGK